MSDGRWVDMGGISIALTDHLFLARLLVLLLAGDHGLH